MKIAIDMPGTINHGMWSPERGESRWSQNVAVALANMGAEVYALGAGLPHWGSCPPIPNISLVPWNTYGKIPAVIRSGVDLYIDACWFDGKVSPTWVPAKAYWHVHFGFEERLKSPDTIKEDHYIVYPYKVGAANFMSDGNPFRDRTIFCPAPFFTETPGKSKFDNKGLLWSGKDTFLNRFLSGGERLLEDSSLMLDVLTYIGDKYPDIPITFLMAHQLADGYNETCEAIKQYDVVNRLSKIKNRHMYGMLTYKGVLDVLSKTQVVTPPHWCGSHLEAVANGVVPLVRQGFIYDEGARKTNSLLPTQGGDKKVIIEQIEHLMFDEVYYNQCLNAYQADMAEHNERYVQNVVSNFVRSLNV